MMGFTTTEIDDAIAALKEQNLKISTINLRRILGRGSYATLQKILQQNGYIHSPGEKVYKSDGRIKNEGVSPSIQHEDKSTEEYSKDDENRNSSTCNSQHAAVNNDNTICTGESFACLISQTDHTIKKKKKDNQELSQKIRRLEEEISNPLLEHQIILKHFNNRCLSGAVGEIPEDLMIILKELIFRTKNRLNTLHNGSDYYEDKAKKLLKIMCLDRNID